MLVIVWCWIMRSMRAMERGENIGSFEYCYTCIIEMFQSANLLQSLAVPTNGLVPGLKF